jgi:short-subunit dehydrogenase
MVTQAFLRLLGTERKGHCIQVGTFGCQLVIPNCSSYSLSKSWLNRFTEYVAAENPNVTAICYNPGSVATAILDVHPDFAYFSQDARKNRLFLTGP